jgi:hypothetical protein
MFNISSGIESGHADANSIWPMRYPYANQPRPMLPHWRRFGFRLAAAAANLVLVLLNSTTSLAACAGDCNSDGSVTVDEVLQGVNIALGSALATDCAAVDANNDGTVTINELLAAVNSALSGCPLNHAPDVACFGIYQGYPGYEIALPIAASDPDGDSLRYAATNLPDGALLDEHTGVFSWTPTTQQFGGFYVPFTVTDNGAPPRSTDGLLTFRVSPQDLCQQITCDPANGCSGTLLPLTQPCCVDLPPRVPEPLAACPEGRVLFVGSNTASGIGRLQDCERLRVINSAQTSATVRLNIEALCVNASDAVTVHARLVAKTRGLVFDSGLRVFLDPSDDGYLQRTALGFPVQTAAPFFDLEGDDADLTVTLTDADGVAVSTHVRVTLTFLPRDDLTDLNASPPAEPANCP